MKKESTLKKAAGFFLFIQVRKMASRNIHFLSDSVIIKFLISVHHCKDMICIVTCIKNLFSSQELHLLYKSSHSGISSPIGVVHTCRPICRMRQLHSSRSFALRFPVNDEHKATLGGMTVLLYMEDCVLWLTCYTHIMYVCSANCWLSPFDALSGCRQSVSMNLVLNLLAHVVFALFLFVVCSVMDTILYLFSCVVNWNKI